MVKRFDQGATVGLCAKAIKAHSVEAFEDVAVLAMLWRMATLLNEALDLLEAGDGSLFASCPARLFLSLDFETQLGEEGVVLFGETLSHAPPPPSCAAGKQRLRPCASP